MLPRKRYLRVLCLMLVTAFGVGSITTSPSQAITGYSPPVTLQSITPNLSLKSNSTSGKNIELVIPGAIKPFSVVGLTWEGSLPKGTMFKTRVRESGKWSSWNELHFSDDHGVDSSSSEGIGTRYGTDPLMTAVADSIEVIMTNRSGLAPKDLRLELIGSQETNEDRALLTDVRMVGAATVLGEPAVTPNGAIAPRPNIVTRAQWGADETWRDPVPRMGTKIVAGFVHHTASTNNYTPEQAPAQMRALYAYFTKSLKYADMGYNFLVDQYGTVYEGRNACNFVSAQPCDGPALPVIGAHTAGFNTNTFAISAIGNYDTKPPANPDALVNSIASLMAWKLAPYGLDPNSNASMVSTDTSGLSKYGKGKTAITPVISGHRDVGKTACPGRYLYPYLDSIRGVATELLTPEISDVSVEPRKINQDGTGNIDVKATIPANANWTVEVLNKVDGQVVNSTSGTQTEMGQIQFAWDSTDLNGQVVPVGRYVVSIKASIGESVLPGIRTLVTVALPPKLSNKVAIKSISPTKTKVVWTAEATDLAPTTKHQFRISQDGKKTWSMWRVARNTEFVTKQWILGKTYYVEFRSHNSIGVSKTVLKKLVVPRYSPTKPEAVTDLTLVSSGPNQVTASWSRVPSDYESLGFYTRVSINENKWSSWKKTSNLASSQVIDANPRDKIRIQVVEKNDAGLSPRASGRFPAR